MGLKTKRGNDTGSEMARAFHIDMDSAKPVRLPILQALPGKCAMFPPVAAGFLAKYVQPSTGSGSPSFN